MRLPSENEVVAVLMDGDRPIGYFTDMTTAEEVSKTLNHAASLGGLYWVADFIPDEPRDDPATDED